MVSWSLLTVVFTKAALATGHTSWLILSRLPTRPVARGFRFSTQMLVKWWSYLGVPTSRVFNPCILHHVEMSNDALIRCCVFYTATLCANMQRCVYPHMCKPVHNQIQLADHVTPS